MAQIPAGYAAINTYLQLGSVTSPEVYTTVANVGSLTVLNMDAKVVDVTSHSIAVPWTQTIPTLLTAGEVTFDLYFAPNDTTQPAGHQQLLLNFTGRVTSYWQVLFPVPNVGNPTNWNFVGYISKFQTKAEVAGVITASVTITVTGAPVFPVGQ
jgi:hypothetical protein